MVGRPINNFIQCLPERLLFENRIGDIGSRNNQRVQPILLELFERQVVLVDIGLSFGAAGQTRNRKRIDEQLSDLIAAADQTHELSLGDDECRIGHHVEKPHMQFTNVLLQRVPKFENIFASLLQILECWQWNVSN